METRQKPPEWRAVENPVGSGKFYLEENVGGVWRTLGDGSAFSSLDARLIVASPALLTKLVGLDLLLGMLRKTMEQATSFRQVREAAADPQLLAFLADVKRVVAEAGGPDGRTK